MTHHVTFYIYIEHPPNQPNIVSSRLTILQYLLFDIQEIFEKSKKLFELWSILAVRLI